jgi:hypothetical protein
MQNAEVLQIVDAGVTRLVRLFDHDHRPTMTLDPTVLVFFRNIVLGLAYRPSRKQWVVPAYPVYRTNVLRINGAKRCLIT